MVDHDWFYKTQLTMVGHDWFYKTQLTMVDHDWYSNAQGNNKPLVLILKFQGIINLRE